MSALSEARKGLATLLNNVTADVPAFSEFPEKAAPPFIAVGPGDPYVEFEGATFGYRRVRLAATYVGQRGTNDIRAGELDDVIVAMVEKIEGDGSYMVTQVEQPGQVSINGQSHLGVSVTALTEIPF